jgi:hypothetical protein
MAPFIFFIYLFSFEGKVVVTLEDTRIYFHPQKDSVIEYVHSPDVFIETDEIRDSFIRVWDFEEGWTWIPLNCRRERVEHLFLSLKDSIPYLVKTEKGWKEGRISFDKLKYLNLPIGFVIPESLVSIKGEPYLGVSHPYGLRGKILYLRLRDLPISKIATALPIIDKQFLKIIISKDTSRWREYSKWYNWLDIMSKIFPDTPVVVSHTTTGFSGPFRKVALQMLIDYWNPDQLKEEALKYRRSYQGFFDLLKEFLEKYERDTIFAYEWRGTGGLWLYYQLLKRKVKPEWKEALFDLLPYSKEPLTQAGLLLLLSLVYEKKGDTSAFDILETVATQFPKSKFFTFKEYGVDFQREAWFKLVFKSAGNLKKFRKTIENYIQMIEKNPIPENLSSFDLISQAVFLGPLPKDEVLYFLERLLKLKEVYERNLSKERGYFPETHLIFKPELPKDPEILLKFVKGAPQKIKVIPKNGETSLYPWPSETLKPIGSFKGASLLYRGPVNWIKIKTASRVGWVSLDFVKSIFKSKTNIFPFCDSLILIKYRGDGENPIAVTRSGSHFYIWDVEEGEILWSRIYREFYGGHHILKSIDFSTEGIYLLKGFPIDKNKGIRAKRRKMYKLEFIPFVKRQRGWVQKIPSKVIDQTEILVCDTQWVVLSLKIYDIFQKKLLRRKKIEPFNLILVFNAKTGEIVDSFRIKGNFEEAFLLDSLIAFHNLREHKLFIFTIEGKHLFRLNYPFPSGYSSHKIRIRPSNLRILKRQNELLIWGNLEKRKCLYLLFSLKKHGFPLLKWRYLEGTLHLHDNKLIAVIDSFLIDIEKLDTLLTLKEMGEGYSINENLLALWKDGTLKLIDLETGDLVKLYDVPNDSIRDVQIESGIVAVTTKLGYLYIFKFKGL